VRNVRSLQNGTDHCNITGIVGGEYSDVLYACVVGFRGEDIDERDTAVRTNGNPFDILGFAFGTEHGILSQ
jgi:hypothetical protein